MKKEISKNNESMFEQIKQADFQNHGYMGLYGGLDAKAIHKQKGLKKSQQILDHMGSTELQPTCLEPHNRRKTEK
jgi:hypothetical protein